MGLSSFKKMELNNVKKITENPNPQNEGSAIQSPDHTVLSLYGPAPLPMITLRANQFQWPSKFLVTSVRRVYEYEIDPVTGWRKKDAAGQKIKTGRFNIRLYLADGDLAIEKLKSANQSIICLLFSVPSKPICRFKN